MAKYYIDISHHETVRSWNTLKQNYPFLISKATEGQTYIDSSLNSFIRNCEEKGIPYWLYAFLKKGDELAQAKFLVNTCKGKVGKHFIGYILDVESGNNVAGVKKAMDYIEALGRKCMIYTMYADYTRYRSVIVNRGKNTAWWEARYGKNDGTYRSKYPCHSGADLHQYSENGTATGMKGKNNIDVNRLTGKKSESWFATKATAKKKSNTEIAKEVIAGKWGNAEERKKKLKAAGYNYAAIQKIVNKICKK